MCQSTSPNNSGLAHGRHRVRHDTASKLPTYHDTQGPSLRQLFLGARSAAGTAEREKGSTVPRIQRSVVIPGAYWLWLAPRQVFLGAQEA